MAVALSILLVGVVLVAFQFPRGSRTPADHVVAYFAGFMTIVAATACVALSWRMTKHAGSQRANSRGAFGNPIGLLTLVTPFILITFGLLVTYALLAKELASQAWVMALLFWPPVALMTWWCLSIRLLRRTRPESSK
jgi:Flp pilus assembly protein TadB